MAKTIRRLDGEFDWCFGKGLSDYATETNAVGYDIVTKLKEWKWDYFEDYYRGIDWKFLLGNKNTKDKLDTDIKSTINAIPEVTSITNYESILNTSERYVTIKVQVATVYGELDLEVII